SSPPPSPCRTPASALVDLDHPSAAPSMPQTHGVARRRENALPRLGPLNERDRLVEVRLEVAPLGRGDAFEAVEVEVGHLPAVRVVAVPDRVRRARHPLPDPEGRAGAAHEGRLPAAELAGDRDDVPGL